MARADSLVSLLASATSLLNTVSGFCTAQSMHVKMHWQVLAPELEQAGTICQTVDRLTPKGGQLYFQSHSLTANHLG